MKTQCNVKSLEFPPLGGRGVHELSFAVFSCVFHVGLYNISVYAYIGGRSWRKERFGGFGRSASFC